MSPMMEPNQRNRSNSLCPTNVAHARVKSRAGRSLSSLIALVLAIGGVFMGLGVAAVPVAAQDSSALPGATAELFHYITGFRSARWGMDEAQVREAIAAAFQITDTGLSHFTNHAETTY